MRRIAAKFVAFALAVGIMWTGVVPALAGGKPKPINCHRYPYCCQCVPYGQPCKTC
jgi:hypothetical protein